MNAQPFMYVQQLKVGFGMAEAFGCPRITKGHIDRNGFEVVENPLAGSPAIAGAEMVGDPFGLEDLWQICVKFVPQRRPMRTIGDR